MTNTEPPPDIQHLLAQWAGITVERFQEEIEAKVYQAKRGKRARPVSRSGGLKRLWQKSVQAGSDGQDRIQIAFLLYGRFVDMGVGRGVDYALSKYARVRSNGERLARKPKRWYSRRKGFETHRLRELLVAYHVDLPVELVENALNLNINLTV